MIYFRYIVLFIFVIVYDLFWL